MWNLEKWYWGTCLQHRDRDADVDNRFVDTGRGGEGGTKGESSTETYTSHMWNRELRGAAAWHRELNPVLCDDLEEWDGVGRGREGYMYSYVWFTVTWQKPTQHCKAVILQLKINLKKTLDQGKNI